MTAGREEIAALLMAQDERSGNGPLPESLLQWGRTCVELGKDAAHDGDCTKKSYSCRRCITDDVLRRADEILALGPALSPQQDCTGWQPIETVPQDQEVEVRGVWKLRGDGILFSHWRPTLPRAEPGIG